MSKRSLPIAAMLALLFGHVAADDLPLTIAQVEKVTGQSGLATKAAKYDKTGTNFVTAQGSTVVTLKVASASVYDAWKSQPSMNDQATYPGLGEDAVISKKGHYICFKKSGQGVCVIGNIDLPGKPALATDAHIAELAKLAAAK